MRFFLLILSLTFSTFCWGDSIPPKLVELIKVYQTEGYGLSEGVLKVKLKKPIISNDTYRGFITGACTPLLLSKKGDGWGNARINRIEIVNEAGGQGFAFPDARKSCVEYGDINGYEENAFFTKKTWVCVAGNPCRPRREGEKISGDGGS